MFISVLDLFKIGIGPSSSHTVGPIIAANRFIELVNTYYKNNQPKQDSYISCTLRGSLAFTGKGHCTDIAVALGLHKHSPQSLADQSVDELVKQIWQQQTITLADENSVTFLPNDHIIFDKGPSLEAHPNGLIFELINPAGEVYLTETYFSIGGGFVHTLEQIRQADEITDKTEGLDCLYPFESSDSMVKMAIDNQLSIADMKKINELTDHTETELKQGLDTIYKAMFKSLKYGLEANGILPGGLNIKRRANTLHQQLIQKTTHVDANDWLCAYAMAVNEENAAGHMVVTAPTNGAAGVIPAVLYYSVIHEGVTDSQIHIFLLTAAAVGGIIKHNSSISGAEVGCQGEVGSAAAMAAAGLCAIRGGSPQQVEHAAEMALEHHLGMTCDPVNGLVQVPCIERNGFGAIKAYTAASLAMKGDGEHFVSLDRCVKAMKQTGLEMSDKYKETALGGLAVSMIEC